MSLSIESSNLCQLLTCKLQRETYLDYEHLNPRGEPQQPSTKTQYAKYNKCNLCKTFWPKTQKYCPCCKQQLRIKPKYHSNKNRAEDSRKRIE